MAMKKLYLCLAIFAALLVSGCAYLDDEAEREQDMYVSAEWGAYDCLHAGELDYAVHRPGYLRYTAYRAFMQECAMRNPRAQQPTAEADTVIDCNEQMRDKECEERCPDGSCLLNGFWCVPENSTATEVSP